MTAPEAIQPARTRALIEASLDRLAPDGPLGIAVSGGGDSVALLVVADAWARRSARELHVATVDHGLRAASAIEAEGVAVFCRRLGRPHETLPVARIDPSGAGNLPAIAREARYGALAGWARHHHLPAILLGHTLDDQAETVLMRLARGSGAEGLSGMDEISTHHDMAWLRPMLDVRRQALRELLREAGVGWVDDPTNEDPAQDRIKARRVLAELAPLGIDAEGLARTADRLRRQSRVLRLDALHLAGNAVEVRAGGVFIDRAALRGAEEDTRLRLVANCIMAITGAEYRPRFRALEPAVDNLCGPEPKRVTLAGCLLEPLPGGDAPEAILICRETSAVVPPQELVPGQTDWDRRWRLSVPASAPRGHLLGAVGEAGMAGISAAASQNDRGPGEGWFSLPAALRKCLPAIRDGSGDIVAVASTKGTFQTLKMPDLNIISEDLVPGRLWASLPGR